MVDTKYLDNQIPIVFKEEKQSNDLQIVVAQYLKERGLRTHVGFNQSVDRHIEPEAQVLDLSWSEFVCYNFSDAFAYSHRKEGRQW